MIWLDHCNYMLFQIFWPLLFVSNAGKTGSVKNRGFKKRTSQEPERAPKIAPVRPNEREITLEKSRPAMTTMALRAPAEKRRRHKNAQAVDDDAWRRGAR